MFACRKQDYSSKLEIGKFFSSVLKRFSKMGICVTTRYCKAKTQFSGPIHKVKVDQQLTPLKLLMKCQNWICGWKRAGERQRGERDVEKGHRSQKPRKS